MVEKIATVPYDKVKRMLESVEFHFQDEPERLNDLELSFEYLIGSCFPDAMTNVRDAISQAHTNGYIAGLADRISTELKPGGARSSGYGVNDLKKIAKWVEELKQKMQDEFIGYEVRGDAAKCIQYVEKHLDEITTACYLSLGGSNET